MPLFGIETEYGIAVEGKGASDLVAESRAVVRAYPGTAAGPWYYRGEDSRNDMRGFYVDRLSQDPEDAKFDSPDHKPLPVEEERGDRILVNGARLYNDHGHPEYSTPECRTLLDLVTHDKAGERIVLEAARARMEHDGVGQIDIYKNNTDHHGSSYGTHENYLVKRGVPFSDLLSALLPFFATRILYAGAGKIGIEPNGNSGVYQLSQRADFFSEEASVDTLYRRPLVNTRDEPHADPREWRRLHVICGDANMSEFATALKVGTTYLVTSLLEEGWRAPIRLRNPVQAIKNVSRDPTYRWLVDVEGQGKTPAVDVQRVFLAAAKERLAGRGADTDWTLRAWEETLNSLESNPLSLDDRLDWVAKRALLADYVESEGIPWSDESLASFDLAYSNIDPEEGLYYALEQSGAMVRLTDDAAIDAARTNAPAETRAAIRGALVERFSENIGVASWNKVVLRSGQESWVADLDPYVTPEDVAPELARIIAAPDLNALLRRYREQGQK
ncbi:proteasome accessory factor PafA2 [Capsulimonas corticalis]|uniref:Proteasome accessory factor PafA2 n=1 Tax=Capsulimonas corticalis TaxID=2219043 RepID=A0A402CPX6_9BACT|nr:proteasome accessory factor PafA2 family protein [Capsulimonas corticalis]BDI32945.1 proteasome accessory factor PafA2 [Capsulimonas corticalis]